MKRSDLKELIKKSMLEVTPKGGEMTPEEEKMVADYEEEEANKYALDKEEPLEEEMSKADKVLNRPSNSISFEQMGMIMMLADELGVNREADEFLSGVVSKKAADEYIKQLIARIDGEEGMMEEDIIAEADSIVASWAEKKTLKEEMHGGYLELMEMNPKFDEGIEMLLEVWEEWKAGEMTEPEMVAEAKQDLLRYLASVLD
jgi:hypothetical protein